MAAKPKVKPCIEPGCNAPKRRPFHRCGWHALATMPIAEQIAAAERRLWRTDEERRRARVPSSEWPAGTRWCAGCQTFVPLFYATGSRCRACASRASHASHLKATYDLSQEDYDALLAWQQGRCYMCARVPRARRLAVDHDHATGEVRGLLCADNERGCNHVVLGNVTGLQMARRIVDYLERPPLQRMRDGEPAPQLVPERHQERR